MSLFQLNICDVCDAHTVSNNLLICGNNTVKNFVKGKNIIRKKHKPIVFLIMEKNTC